MFVCLVLTVSSPVCLSACLSGCVALSLTLSLSLSLSPSPCVCLSLYLSPSLVVYLPDCLSVSVFAVFSFRLSVLSVFLNPCLSVCCCPIAYVSMQYARCPASLYVSADGIGGSSRYSIAYALHQHMNIHACMHAYINVHILTSMQS